MQRWDSCQELLHFRLAAEQTMTDHVQAPSIAAKTGFENSSRTTRGMSPSISFSKHRKPLHPRRSSGIFRRKFDISLTSTDFFKKVVQEKRKPRFDLFAATPDSLHIT